jgi:hypothetical protein
MSDLARVFLRTSTVSNIKLSDYFTHLELLTTENKRNVYYKFIISIYPIKYTLIINQCSILNNIKIIKIIIINGINQPILHKRYKD